MSARIRLLAMVLSLIGTGSACSSAPASRATSTTTSTTTIATTTTAPVASSTQPASPAPVAPTTAPTEAATASGPAACAQVKTALDRAAGGAELSLESGTPAGLQESVRVLAEFARSAPPEIKADVTIISEGYAQLVAAIVASGVDLSGRERPSPDQLNRLIQVAQDLATPAFRAAGNRLSDYVDKNC
ncbi:MAG: hypothetical protein ACT4OM_01260 [Actinomycetota bacterium]